MKKANCVSKCYSAPHLFIQGFPKREIDIICCKIRSLFVVVLGLLLTCTFSAQGATVSIPGHQKPVIIEYELPDGIGEGDIEGCGERALWLDLSVPQGGIWGDANTPITIRMQSIANSPQSNQDFFKTQLFIDNEELSCSDRLYGVAKVCDFDHTYTFSPGDHKIMAKVYLRNINGSSVNACGSNCRQSCSLERVANFKISEPPPGNDFRISQSCKPFKGLTGDTVICTAVVNNLRVSQTANKIDSLQFQYVVWPNDEVNLSDYSVNLSDLRLNTDPNAPFKCTQSVSAYISSNATEFNCVVNEITDFLDLVTTFEIVSSAPGAFQTLFTANTNLASSDLVIDVAQPRWGFFTVGSFNVLIEGDFDGDACVDMSDLKEILRVVRGGLPQDTFTNYDLNGDSIVNIADARQLVTLFTNYRGAACF